MILEDKKAEEIISLAGYDERKLELKDWIDLTLKTGEVSLEIMKLLDEANTKTYGNPEPTKVNVSYKKGPCILITGHDLHDLYLLLKHQ